MLTVHVILGCGGWLLSRDDDELLSCWSPDDVLDLVVENRDKMSILPLVDSHVLQRVFSVVTFA